MSPEQEVTVAKYYTPVPTDPTVLADADSLRSALNEALREATRSLVSGRRPNRPLPPEGPPTPPGLWLDLMQADLTPIVYALLEHHSPDHYQPDQDGNVWGWHCEGCDQGSHAEDSPYWPCSTVNLIAAHLGLETE